VNLRGVLSLAERSAASLRRVRGTKRFGVAVGLGASGALAFEPFRAFPLLLLSYAGLVLLLDGVASSRRRFRDAAIVGWSYGFGFFLVGLHWIGYAFLVDAATHAWELPFALLLLPSGFGLFFAAAAALCMLRWRRGMSRIFVFALAFFLVEWMRGHILTGFPWNLPAYGWAASTALLQSASVFGAYGLSLLTLLYGASFALLATPSSDRRARWMPLALTVLFLGLWANGEARLLTATDATVPGVRLRIVQPAIPQSEKYVPEFRPGNWQRLIDLSERPASVEPTHIVWPEAAAIPPVGPTFLELSPVAEEAVARVTGESRVLLTGYVRVEEIAGAPRFYNSFAIYGPHGNFLATYDKFHLVPFGEYLPLENWLRAMGLSEIAASTGFSSGPGPKTFMVPNAPPVGPLICYEAIFPQAVTGAPRPSWLVNVTDDSWFGPNAGPMQHLLITRVRAIEEGLPIVRAANSGISAVIDSYGRERARLALGLQDVIDADLPVALPVTPFARYGTFIMLGLALICAGAALWPLRSTQT
jgi:apolipoprotein N-acyltransferase